MMTWNPKAGGFNSYQSTAVMPERDGKVMAFLHGAKQQHNLDTVIIPDAFRWQDIYEGEVGIARKLGYKTAYYVLMDDEKLSHDEGRHIGVAFATDKPVHATETIDLGTRQGLNAILDIGPGGVQISSVYLDHDDESRRLQQAKALVTHLRKNDIPTIIGGDLNGLQAVLSNASFGTRAKDELLRRVITRAPERLTPRVATALNQRQAVPYLLANGYVNADPFSRPTCPSRLPMVEVDYLMHTADITASNTQVLRPGTSDHRAVVTTAQLAVI